MKSGDEFNQLYQVEKSKFVMDTTEKTKVSNPVNPVSLINGQQIKRNNWRIENGNRKIS